MAEPRKIFDVMRPGQAPASPTARPVIVGHKPQVQNPLEGGATTKFAANPAAPQPLIKNPELKIQPPAGAPSAAAQPTTPQPVSTPQPQPKSADMSSVSKPIAPTVPQPTTPNPQPTVNLKPPAPSPKVPATQPQVIDPLRAEQDMLADTSNAVKNDRFVVSHHTTSPFRTKHWLKVTLLIALIILLAAIVLDVILDVGWPHLTLNLPHTNFFKAYHR